MKKFFKIFKASANVQGTIAIKNKKGECQLHDITRLKHLKANEFCVSCSTEMCYICSSQHIANHCDVSWGEDSYKKYNLAPKSMKNKDYNCGHLAKLHLQNLKCPCGNINQNKAQYIQCKERLFLFIKETLILITLFLKQFFSSNLTLGQYEDMFYIYKKYNKQIGKSIEHEINAGICAACSTATCSKECHDKYAKEVNQCTFHHNFTEDMPTQTMRSVLFRNSYYLFDNGYGIGTPISKTSKNFTSGYTSDKRDSIYLQRGFRIYGNPADETLQNLEVYSEVNVDFVVHKERVCLCSCNVCSPRSIHSQENCSIHCQSDETLVNILKTLSITCIYFQNIAILTRSKITLKILTDTLKAINIFIYEKQYNFMGEICHPLMAIKIKAEVTMGAQGFHEECHCKCKFCSSGILRLIHHRTECLFHCEHSSFSTKK